MSFRGYGEQTVALVKDGNVGQGIDSIVEQYYLSTSKTSLVGGQWSDTPPSSRPDGTYVWKRYKITYKNPAEIEYTTPVCDPFWGSIDNIEQDIIEVNKITTNTQLQVDKLNKEIETKVTQDEINQSINGIRPDIEKANQGLNKWMVEIYDKTLIPEDKQESIELDAFFGENVRPLLTLEVKDQDLSTTLHTGSNYIGYALTFVKFSAKTSITTTIDLSPLGTLYINSQDVTKTKSQDVVLNFVQGWNVVEVVWNVSSETAGGFKFGTQLSSKCEVMNCYYRIITSRDTAMVSRYAGIKVNLDSVQTQVSKTESIIKEGTENIKTLTEQISQIDVDLDGIRNTVESNKMNSDGMFEELSSNIEQLAGSIKNTVSREDIDSIIQSTIIQNADSWRADFRENGLVEGSINMNKNGLIVSSPDGHETRVTQTEFAGYYNQSKIFWFDQDEMVSARIRVNKGIDLQSLKLMPIEQDGHRGVDILGSRAII